MEEIMKNLFLTLVLLILTSGNIFSQYSGGNALYFDGENDYVRISDADNLDIISNLTISAWVYGDNYQVDDLFVHKINAYGISIREGGEFSLLLSQNPSGTVWERFSSNFIPSEKTWYHFTATYDSSAQEVKLYVNGNLRNTIAYSGPIAVSTGALCIGGYSGGQNHFGIIDEVRIWKVTRSQEQILSTFSDTLAWQYYTTNDSGLVGYWRFDEGIPAGNNTGVTTLPDLTTNAYNGTLYNFALTGDTSNWVSSEAPITDIHNSQLNYPYTVQLEQNYPNPFNPTTQISYSLLKSDFVSLKIYNTLGQEIQTLVNEYEITGVHTVRFDSKNLSSGIYFYRLQVGNNFIQTKKMILMR